MWSSASFLGTRSLQHKIVQGSTKQSDCEKRLVSALSVCVLMPTCVKKPEFRHKHFREILASVCQQVQSLVKMGQKLQILPLKTHLQLGLFALFRSPFWLWLLWLPFFSILAVILRVLF